MVEIQFGKLSLETSPRSDRNTSWSIGEALWREALWGGVNRETGRGSEEKEKL